DRATIGFAHLLGVEHTHRKRAYLHVLDFVNERGSVSTSMSLCGAVYVNGRIARAEEATIPVYDHGFLYGEGVYETLRTYNRVPFLYDRHLRRLRASAGYLELAIPFTDDELASWIADTMAA